MSCSFSGTSCLMLYKTLKVLINIFIAITDKTIKPAKLRKPENFFKLICLLNKKNNNTTKKIKVYMIIKYLNRKNFKSIFSIKLKNGPNKKIKKIVIEKITADLYLSWNIMFKVIKDMTVTHKRTITGFTSTTGGYSLKFILYRWITGKRAKIKGWITNFFLRLFNIVLIASLHKIQSSFRFYNIDNFLIIKRFEKAFSKLSLL